MNNISPVNNEWLTSRERWIYGGLGSLAPIFVTAIGYGVHDLSIEIQNTTVWLCIGFIVKVCLMFIVGGFVCFLYKNVDTEIRAFIVGISAPSLITGYLVQSTNNNIGYLDSVPTIIDSAYAQDENDSSESEYTLANVEIKKFEVKPESILSQFLRGLLGRRRTFENKSDYLGFVDSIQYNNNNDLLIAKKFSVLINSDLQNNNIQGKAVVYDATSDLSKYLIVIENIDESKINHTKAFEMGEYVNYGKIKIKSVSPNDLYVENVNDRLPIIDPSFVEYKWKNYTNDK